MERLHERGYVRMDGWMSQGDAEELLEACGPVVEGATHIFNSNPEQKEDRKRVQEKMPKRLSAPLEGRLRAAFPDKQVNDFVILKSKAGCQRQSAHTDYVPTEEIVDATDEEIPLLFLLALEEGTRLCVWPRSHRLFRDGLRRAVSCEEVEMSVGDAILFRGDLVHAGSSYERDCIRIHAYIDSPTIKRKPNTTYTIHKHATDEVRSKIIEN